MHDTSQVDEAILASVASSWSKVAMVIARTEDKLGQILPDREKGLNFVAERIEALVNDGRLTAQGDIKKWRHSEVRKP